MTDPTAYLPFASLVVALLAVIIGPWISWRVVRHQSQVSLALANKQIIAPMRQAWIDKLRSLSAEVLSVAWWYFVSGQAEDELEDEEIAGSRVERRLRFRLQEIELLINPAEEDHRILLDLLDRVIACAFPGEHHAVSFPNVHREAVAQCQRVFKREWEVVKKEGLHLSGARATVEASIVEQP